MDKKTALVVKVWVYFGYNYPDVEGMIDYICKQNGVRSAVDCLYGDLDTGNRDKLVARAIECYDGMRELK